MAVQSDYVTGTVTLTNGSVDFTGIGTAWLLAGFKEGDTILDVAGASGRVGVVASITSNTAGTLTKPWEGPTLANVAYRMRYQPDGSRVTAEARNLIEVLGSGNIQSFAGISAADVLLKAQNGADFANKRQTLDNLMLQGANLASAATLNLGDATGHFVDVTGTVATTAITLTDGSWRLVRAAAAWPIVQGASLSVNDGATGTYTCAAGDMILFVADGTVIRGIVFPVDGQPVARVANNHLAQIATARLKGRVTAATGDVEDLTQAQVRTFLGQSTYFNTLLGAANGGALFGLLGATESTGSNGYTKLPNGILLQWGYFSTVTASATITFPIAFPGACRGLGHLLVTANTSNIFSLVTAGVSLTGFSFTKKFSSGAGVGDATGEPFYWMAVGI